MNNPILVPPPEKNAPDIDKKAPHRKGGGGC